MNDLQVLERSDLVAFQPNESLAKVAKVEAVIDFSKRVRDWELLERAADAKIEELAELVRWWDERVRPAGQGNISDTEIILSADKAQELTGFSTVQVSRIRKKLKDAAKYKADICGAAWKKAFPDAVRGTEGTGENEWYTPQKYIAAVHEVMGNIDLDPATSELANETVGALSIFDANANGLIHDWWGNVWMNPPYAQPLIAQFCGKLRDEYDAGRVQQAICLTHNYTDTSWFHYLQQSASAICFTRGRVKFESPGGDLAAPTQGQTFFYLGKNHHRFEQIFSQFGFVVRSFANDDV